MTSRYLFDVEREQHAALALSLIDQVLRARLNQVKTAVPGQPDETGATISPNQVSRPWKAPFFLSPESVATDRRDVCAQGVAGSSRSLSLLMDVFRVYDRLERNLPGREATFGSVLAESYRCFKGIRPESTPVPGEYRSESTLDADRLDLRVSLSTDGAAAAAVAGDVLEQALAFCKTKQAQSRVRVGGGRGGGAGRTGERVRREAGNRLGCRPLP